MLKLFVKLIRFFASIWSLMIIGLMALWIIVYLGAFSIESKFIGLSYLPPYSFLLLFLPGFLLFAITGQFKKPLTFFSIYILFFLAFGDFSYQKTDHQPFTKNSKTQELSAVALNLRYYSYGFDKVLKGIKTIDADVYLLSENEITDQQLLQMNQSIAPWNFFMGRQEGTAIISRYPFISIKEIEFTSKQASLFKENEVHLQHLNPNRSFVHAIIDVNGVPVNVISVRFLAGRAKTRNPADAVPWAFYVLKNQIDELTLFTDYLRKLEGPIIFGGDLNAPPSSVVVKELSKLAIDAYLTDHFWGEFTFWTNFPPYARLDFLFSMNQVQSIQSKILDVIISDHYPVYARFRIPAKE